MTLQNDHLNKEVGDAAQSGNASMDGGEAATSSVLNNSNSKDAFMTDAIQLIGIIYKYAKIRNIPANEFEQIIMRSYEIAWKI